MVVDLPEEKVVREKTPIMKQLSWNSFLSEQLFQLVYRLKRHFLYELHLGHALKGALHKTEARNLFF